MILDDFVQTIEELQLIRLMISVEFDSKSERLLDPALLLFRHLKFVYEPSKLVIDLLWLFIRIK